MLERKEKILKKLEKMKKAELIEYVMNMIDEQADRSVKTTELLNELSFAEQRVRELEEELESVKKNHRGAGRKEKFNKEQTQQIIEARKQGKSIRVIAKEFNCSAALIHKIINKKEEIQGE